MNQARIWLVVKPSVGIPMILTAVVIASLLVHAAILTHTTWFPAFLQGGRKMGALALPAMQALGLA